MKKGDTLYSIGQQYGVTYQDIADLNKINPNAPLVIGETLIIINKPIIKKYGDIEVNGYAFTNIDRTILEDVLPYLTYLSIFSYQILEDGSLKPINDDELISLSKKYKTLPVMVITNIGSLSNFSSDLVSTVLSDEKIQDTLIDNIIKTMESKGYAGLDVDFEYVYPKDKQKYNMFLNKIKPILLEHGYFLTTAVAPKTSDDQSGILYESHDYTEHGKVSNHVIIMTYEWGYSKGPPLPVAPITKVEEVLKYAVTKMPSEKILMGIPNYGYDWALPYKEGTKAKSVGNYEAVDLARDRDTSIQYDEKEKVPFYNYYNEDIEHIVWFEDARSIETKLKLANQYKLGGVSYWTIDRFFPQNWIILDSLFNIKKY